MRTRVAGVDTNVVVSGLLTSDPRSPTARVLDGLIAGTLQFALSLPLLAEYRTVLFRERIRERDGLASAEVDRILAEITVHGRVLESPDSGPPAPDSGDQHLWDLLSSVKGSILVTGDERLLETGRFRVLSPAAFVREIDLEDG